MNRKQISLPFILACTVLMTGCTTEKGSIADVGYINSEKESGSLVQDTKESFDELESSADEVCVEAVADNSDLLEVETEIWVYDPMETANMERIELDTPFFEGGGGGGTLSYTINQCEVFESLSECSLSADDFYSVDNFLKADGELLSDSRIVMLNVTIKNIDALGIIKKTEFNLSGITLMDMETGEVYMMDYFSEAENSPQADDPFYYNLEQGCEMQVQVGFLMPAECVESGQVMGRHRDTLIELGL